MTENKAQIFLTSLYERIFKWCYFAQDRYWDIRRFGPPPQDSFADKIKHKIKVFAASKLRCAARQFSLSKASKELCHIALNVENYGMAYGMLADDYSRQVFLDILAFRVLGGAHVGLPLNTKEYWKNYDDDKSPLKKNTIRSAQGQQFNQYNITGKTGELTINMLPGGFQYCFLIKAYEYNKENQLINVRSGDVVIDGGACWGETALFFADCSAPDGKVYSFEFDPDNLRILHLNLELNQKLAKRIECVEYAISDSSDKELAFESQGPGTTVEQIKTGGKNLNAITSLSIDDLVKKKQLTNVNFIKLDIEGAELKGLQGAEQTLKTFKPKLAISAYHKKEDLFTLIQYLEGLKIGYRFYMDHFTVHGEETVLFATCD